MSRRKQSNPRQIKRSLGDMEATQGTQAVGTSLTEREATVPEPEPAGQPEPPSTPGTDTSPPSPPPAMSPGGSEEMEGEEPEPRPAKEAAEDNEEEEPGSCWSGPDELELVLQEGQKRVRARLSLSEGTSWGPFPGTIQTTACPPGQEEPSPALTLQLVDEACWLWALPRAPTAAEANLEICRKDEALWCRVTKPVPAGGLLCVLLTAEPHGAASHPVKEEPAEAPCLAPMATADIHLLPQQAGMASVLATAIINSEYKWVRASALPGARQACSQALASCQARTALSSGRGGSGAASGESASRNPGAAAQEGQAGQQTCGVD